MGHTSSFGVPAYDIAILNACQVFFLKKVPKIFNSSKDKIFQTDISYVIIKTVMPNEKTDFIDEDAAKEDDEDEDDGMKQERGTAERVVPMDDGEVVAPGKATVRVGEIDGEG